MIAEQEKSKGCDNCGELYPGKVVTVDERGNCAKCGGKFETEDENGYYFGCNMN